MFCLLCQIVCSRSIFIVIIKEPHYDRPLEMRNIPANSMTADKCHPTDCSCVNVHLLDKKVSHCCNRHLLGLLVFFLGIPLIIMLFRQAYVSSASHCFCSMIFSSERPLYLLVMSNISYFSDLNADSLDMARSSACWALFSAFLVI